MMRLAEVVEAVLNELAIARTKAALFGAQMTADFREHELLRQLSVPVYKIRGAEINLPFVVSNIARAAFAEHRFDHDELSEAARQVAGSLFEQNGLAGVFGLYDSQAVQWQQEVAPTIEREFVADAPSELSIDGLSALYGSLVKSQYLASLIKALDRLPREKARQSLLEGHADLVASMASRLLKEELERRAQVRETPEKVEDRDREGPLAIYVDIAPTSLTEAEHVSTLKLELDEGVLTEISYPHAEEATDESQ